MNRPKSSGRFVCFVAAVVLCLPSLRAAAQEPVTIEFWAESGWETWINPAIERFEALNPGVDVDVVFSPAGPSEQFTVRALGGTAPDVASIYPQRAGSVITAGLVRPLEPFFEADPEVKLSDFVPSSYVPYQFEGHVYGLLHEISLINVAVNKGMIERAGLVNPRELGTDWTWERQMEYARVLTQDVSGDGAVDQWGFSVHPTLQRFLILVHQAGGAIVDNPTAPSQSLWLDAPVRRTFEYLLEFYQRGLVSTTRLGSGGNVAIDIGGNAIEALHMSEVDWDISHWAYGPAHNGVITSGTGFLMSKDTAHPQESWRLIRYLLTDREVFRLKMNFELNPSSYLPLISEFNLANAPSYVPPHVMEIMREMVTHPALGIVPAFLTYSTVQSRFNAQWRDNVTTFQVPLERFLEEMHHETTVSLQRE